MSPRAWIATILCALALWAPLVLLVALAHGQTVGCRTHRCWHKIHVARLDRMVERRIERVAPLRCYGQPSAVPCWIIMRESRGSWTAWNPQPVHGFHARGFYQLLGHGEPWPVIVRSHYETLKRKLAHHRIAAHLWHEQQAGQARHW